MQERNGNQNRMYPDLNEIFGAMFVQPPNEPSREGTSDGQDFRMPREMEDFLRHLFGAQAAPSAPPSNEENQERTSQQNGSRPTEDGQSNGPSNEPRAQNRGSTDDHHNYEANNRTNDTSEPNNRNSKAQTEPTRCCGHCNGRCHNSSPGFQVPEEVWQMGRRAAGAAANAARGFASLMFLLVALTMLPRTLIALGVGACLGRSLGIPTKAALASGLFWMTLMSPIVGDIILPLMSFLMLIRSMHNGQWGLGRNSYRNGCWGFGSNFNRRWSRNTGCCR